jgi:hypothetical protein
MCVFCAAVPATLAIGTVAESKQREATRKLEPGMASSHSRGVPALALAAIATFGLLLASVVYHSGRLN